MTTYWIDGEWQVEPLSAGVTARLAIATLPCPTAWVSTRSLLGAAVAADELRHSASSLGHTVEDGDGLTRAIEALVTSSSSELLQLALVPDQLPPSAADRWERSRLVGWRHPAGTSPWTAIFSEWPVNNHSPAVGLRLTASGEVLQGRRAAETVGAHSALWGNLDAHLARFDEWSVIVEDDDKVLSTPRIRDGSPYDAWLDRLVTGGNVSRRAIPFSPESLSRPSVGLAAIAPWGEAAPVVTSDAQRLSSIRASKRVQHLLSTLD